MTPFPMPWFSGRSLSGYEMLTKDLSVAPGQQGNASIMAPAGKKVLSGGWEQDGDWFVGDSFPINDARGSGWGFVVINRSTQPDVITLYAVFASG